MQHEPLKILDYVQLLVTLTMSLKCTALLLKTQDTVPTLRVTHSQSSHQPTNYEIDQPTVERYDCVFLVSGWIRFLSTPMHTRRYLFGRHTLDFCFSPPHSTINSRHSEIKNKFHLNYKLEVRQSHDSLEANMCEQSGPPKKKLALKSRILSLTIFRGCLRFLFGAMMKNAY